MPPRVYLTGFMATGKSTVGPLLADALGYRFADLDWLVTARTGRSVPELFAEGEAVFRAAEAEALRETAASECLVVSTGGGTLVEPRNMIAARAAGPVVWLRSSVPTIVRRVGRNRGRPLRELRRALSLSLRVAARGGCMSRREMWGARKKKLCEHETQKCR